MKLMTWGADSKMPRWNWRLRWRYVTWLAPITSTHFRLTQNSAVTSLCFGIILVWSLLQKIHKNKFIFKTNLDPYMHILISPCLIILLLHAVNESRCCNIFTYSKCCRVHAIVVVWLRTLSVGINRLTFVICPYMLR